MKKITIDISSSELKKLLESYYKGVYNNDSVAILINARRQVVGIYEDEELVTIKFVVLEGGPDRKVVAPDGVTINGEANKPCVLGVTADGIAISGDVITFMWVTSKVNNEVVSGWEIF